MKRVTKTKNQRFLACPNQHSHLNKRGQMKLSFGMIFSIILIIVFLAFSIYAIMKFLGWQESVLVGKFFTNLQGDVDKLWKGTQGSIEQEYRLPKDVEKVCFASFDDLKKGRDIGIYDDLKMAFFEYENLILYPIGSGGGLDAYSLKHINLTSSVSNENPLCMDNVKGKVKIGIRMNPGDSLVTITKPST